VSDDPGEIAYSGEDVDGASISGSIQLTNLVGSSFAVGQCVDLGSAENGVSALLRVDAAPDVELTAMVACESFEEPACGGASLGVNSADSPFQDTSGAWLPLSLVVGDEGASALCTFGVELLAGAAFEAYLDDFTLPRPFFRDGFETGDTSGWTLIFPVPLED